MRYGNDDSKTSMAYLNHVLSPKRSSFSSYNEFLYGLHDSNSPNKRPCAPPHQSISSCNWSVANSDPTLDVSSSADQEEDEVYSFTQTTGESQWGVTGTARCDEILLEPGISAWDENSTLPLDTSQSDTSTSQKRRVCFGTVSEVENEAGCP